MYAVLNVQNVGVNKPIVCTYVRHMCEVEVILAKTLPCSGRIEQYAKTLVNN